MQGRAMFALAILIGIYSYIIFGLGVLGLIYRPIILTVTVMFLLLIALSYRKYVIKFISNISTKKFNASKLLSKITKNKLIFLLSGLLVTQAFVNLIGVFGPEISFDALWYHLTLPKIYIFQHAITHIPGNLMFYSDMPKLTEMLYTSAMILGNAYFAKLIHYSFGILILAAIYKVSTRLMSKEFSILASVIFYSNLVVGWESIAGYIDLSRTFFEIMAFWAFWNWTEKKENKWIVLLGLMLGLSVSAKLISIESLFIFLGLFLYQMSKKRKEIAAAIKNIFTVSFFTILIPLPWFIFSFINTGNPFYPYFSSIPVDSGKTFVFPNVLNIFNDMNNLFLRLNDPISPVYLILIPVIIVYFKRFDARAKNLVIYSLLGLFIWYLTQQSRGGRFIMPFLPVASILCTYAVTKISYKKLRQFIIAVIIFVSLVSVGYRAIANSKFVPYLLGKETEAQFLKNHLNFSFGDFYDTDRYFKNHLTKNDRVLLYGFSNLYYVNFNYIHASWAKRGDVFNYIAVQDATLPERFNFWNQVYYNSLTHVRLYSLGGQQWVY